MVDMKKFILSLAIVSLGLSGDCFGMQKDVMSVPGFVQGEKKICKLYRTRYLLQILNKTITLCKR